jgi:hypothetical protein
MRKIFYFILLNCLLTITAQSQNNYYPGYIVNHDEDTIRGLILDTKNAEMYNRVHFKDAMGNESILTTGSINMYKVNDTTYYRKMYPYSYDSYYFFKLKQSGTIKIYEFIRSAGQSLAGNLKGSTNGANSTGVIYGDPINHDPNLITFIEKGKTFRVVNWSNFLNLMKKFIKDDPELLEKLLNGEYQVKDFYKLVDNYNSRQKKAHQN